MRRETREKRIQQIIGGLVSADSITADSISTLWNINRKTAEEMIREAEERLAARSVVNVDAERGKAIQQLEELYRLAIAKKDLRNALATRSELSRLLSLDATATPTSTVDESEVERCRMALESLGIAETGLPLDELGRQVVLYILSNKRNGEMN